MEISYDEFFQIHCPKKSTDLIVRSKRVLVQIKRKFKSKRSFIFVSGKHGYGKHEILNVLGKEDGTISLVSINDDSTVNSIERKNEVNFDMTGFLNENSILKKQREIFVIEEEVIKSSSCISIMNALMKVHKQCIFLYTTHYVIITKRACCNLARNVYGNIRVLLMLVYRLLVKSKNNNKNVVTTPLVLNVLKQNRMDGFTHFNDIQQRCLKSTSILTYNECIELCMSQSYATKMYCYNSVIKKSIHPWCCNTLNITEIAQWTDLFCFNDIINNYKSDYDDFVLPLFLLM